MEGLGSIPEISALQVGDVSKPEKSMGSGSSDTAEKQSSKLSHQYWDFRKITTTLNSLGNRLKQAVSQGNRFKQDSIASQRLLFETHFKLDFFLERVVPGAEGMVIDKVGAGDLISALNMPLVPSEIKAIRCSFSRTSAGSKWDEDIFKAIDAIGKCQNLEKLTINLDERMRMGLALECLERLCQSVQTSKVGHLEVNAKFYGPTTMTTVCKMVESNHNLKHLTFSLAMQIDVSGADSLGSMLAKNSTLEHLDLGDSTIDPTGIKLLLRPLTGAQGKLPINTSLKHISVPSVSEENIGHRVAEAVAAMLTSNKALTHLNLGGYVFSEPSDVCMVLLSLRTNETLQTLDLVGCRSHFEWEEDVFPEMLHLTQANLSLKSIELSVAQFGEGYIEAVKAQLAANAIKRSGTNVENVREKALHNPTMPQFLVEIDVPQEILECRPSDSLEIGLDNLEENQVMQNTTSIANDRSQFCLRNDVLGTSTSSIDSVTSDIDDLVSRLNMACAFSVIDCNFQLGGSYSALDRKKRLKAIDAIGRCQSLKQLTISGKLDSEQIQQLCKSLQATQVEYLELCMSGLPFRGLINICETLVVIPSLKHFKLIDKTMKTFVGVSLGSMVAKNSTLEHLDLGDSIWKLTISGKLDSEQIQQLCKSLQATQVEYLELCILQLCFTQLTIICELLVVIPSLKHFKFIDKTAKASVGAIFGSMLVKNSTLEHLDLVSCKWDPNGIEALLQPLKGTSTQLPLNRSLKHLSINAAYKHGLRCEGAKAIARMLGSNKTLTHFSLSADYSLEPDDVCLILSSLKTNESLQTLGLENCLGVRGRQVFMVMLELTQANPWLKSIELSGTQLEEEQKEAVREQLAANAIQRSEINVENGIEKAGIDPLTLQRLREVEVLQEMIAIRPSDPLEVGIDNLEECSTSTINMSSSINVQDNNMKSQVLGDRINMATTIELSTTHILDLFHQACNSITKVLKIKRLPRIYQQADVGVHDSSAILQVLEKISQQNPRGIIVAARIQAHEQQIQFLFANACGMASIVGVGLDFATVYWTRRNEVFVKGIEEDDWLQLWTEALTKRGSFHKPIIMHMPTTSSIMMTELDDTQTFEDTCWDDVLGSISSCGEVLLLKLIVNFFMTREVFGKITKSQNHDSSMTTKGSGSTLPNVANNVEHEGSEYCNVVKKANMMGQTQLPKDLLGLLWNFVLRNGNTNAINGSGEGHHEGDQGASRQNGNGENNHGGGNDNNDDGDGENNHGGGNDNNDDGDGESPSSDLTLEGQCGIVDIDPCSGGKWDCPRGFVLGEDLEHAHIEPRLCFEFSRSKEGNKKIFTRLSTRFDLRNAIPKDDEEDRFGWFQTHLNVSLESSGCRGAAKLQHNEKVLQTQEEVQTCIHRVSSQSNSGSWQLNLEAQAGVAVAKGKVGASKSTKTKSLLTETVIEIPNKQILGGFAPANRTSPSPTPCLAFNFDFPKYPTNLNDIDEERRNWYLRSGLCSTVTPIIEGTWDHLNEDVASLYTFRAKRRVRELTYESPSTRNLITSVLGMTKSKLPTTKLMKIEQVYELKLYVNHKMTHICNSQVTLKENEACHLLTVGEIEIASSSSGSSSASANNI